MSNKPKVKRQLATKNTRKAATKRVLIAHKRYLQLNIEVDDTQYAAMLRAMVDLAGAPVAMFARFMGISRRALYQYLAGTRQVPKVALNAARFALGTMGIPLAISGDEVRQNLGYLPAAPTQDSQRPGSLLPGASRSPLSPPAPRTPMGDV